MNNSCKELNYSLRGTGPFLVVIHGFLESNSMWDPLHLEEDFTCVRIELPGHGSSNVENSEQTISFMSECLNLTIEKIGLLEFDIIGHSLGGYVALEYVSKFDLSGKLILLHSNFWEDDARKKIDRQRVANIVLKNKNLFLNEALPGLFIDPKKHFTIINNLLLSAKKMLATSIADCSIAMQKRRNHEATMNKHHSTIKLIQGEFDRLVPPKKMEEMLVGMKNELIIIPDAGHMGQHENTALVKKAILGLLKK
jgi:pimeloyl-ACP methyl ester carboxylesterase